MISCPVSERKAAGVRETLGYICFILDLKPIMALMESLRVTKSAEFVLTDEAGNFISGTKNGAGLWDIMKERPIKSNTESFEQGYYCLSHGLDTSDFSFYCFIPEKEFFSYAGTMKKYVGLLILLNICIVAAMAVYMNRSMGKPIKQLLWTIHEVRDGDVVVRSGSRDQGEIGNLARNFDEMMDRVTMLSQESIKNQSRMYELMLRRNEMELIALQNQINPHFLYNTLACIRGIAICNRQTEIAAVTKALAKIYNYILRSPEIVTVREEITIVESFMDIYKVRIGSRVSGTVQIDEKLMDQKIMKLLIQPLVENAMEHGICQKIDGGTVKILGTGGTERMRFVIEDDGCGMEASQVEALNRIAAEGAVASNGEQRKKYGMYNIITRLKLMYGHGFLFRCESRKDAGTRITVEIPYTMPEGLEVPADVEGSDDRR